MRRRRGASNSRVSVLGGAIAATGAVWFSHSPPFADAPDHGPALEAPIPIEAHADRWLSAGFEPEQVEQMLAVHALLTPEELQRAYVVWQDEPGAVVVIGQVRFRLGRGHGEGGVDDIWLDQTPQSSMHALRDAMTAELLRGSSTAETTAATPWWLRAVAVMWP